MATSNSKQRLGSPKQQSSTTRPLFEANFQSIPIPGAAAMTQGPASSYPLVSTQTNIEYARGFYDDKVGGIMPSIMPNAPHRQAADSFRNEHDRRGGKAPEGSHFDRLDRSYHENNQAYKDLNAALKAADKRVKDQEALRRLSEQYTQTASAAQK